MNPRVDYTLVDSPRQFATAAAALAAGRGPFAVDTERASAFRYDDRAFLVQVYRRDSGTFLIAPEGHRAEVTEVFGPVLNGGEWIIHAAGEDLRSLAQLGLTPGSLFDTELAARLAGFDRPNLGAMVAHFVGVELEKGHGHEDWSTMPLPDAWQEYAALDVAYLHPLAEALAEQLDAEGKLAIAAEEFTHLIHAYAHTSAPEKTWRDLKGVSTVRTPSGLQLVRELWRARDEYGRSTDTSPSRLLSNRTLVEIARAEPDSHQELLDALGRERLPERRAKRIQRVIQQALEADVDTWPTAHKHETKNSPPGKGTWERHYPDSWQMLQHTRTRVAEVSAALQIPPELVLAPATLRSVAWNAPSTGPAWDTHTAATQLRDAGARQWQIELTAPVIAAAHAETVRLAVAAREGQGRRDATRRRRRRRQAAALGRD